MILASGNQGEALQLKTYLYPPKIEKRDTKRDINVFYRFNDKATFISIIVAFLVCYIFALGSFGVLIYLREQNFAQMMTELIVASDGADSVTNFLTYKYDTMEFIFNVITLNLTVMGVVLSMLIAIFYKQIVAHRTADKA